MAKLQKKNVGKVKIDLGFQNLKGFFKVGASSKRTNIPTGHWSLDYGLHYGSLPSDHVDLSAVKGYDPKVALGLPMGRLVQLYGAQGSGKSSLAYRVCGNAQKMGYSAVWIDAQQSFEQSLAKLNGVDIDNLIYSNCMSLDDPDKEIWAEDILDSIFNILKTASQNNIGVLVLDSVAGLTPKDVGQNSVQKQGMAQLARVLSKSVPKICQCAAKYNVLVIFINQIRQKVGIQFGDPEQSTGGRVIKFQASVRLKVNKRGTDDSIVWAQAESGKEQDRRVVGRVSGVSIVKNRCAKPLLTNKGKSIVLDIPIYYEAFFPDADQVAFDEARRLKLVSVRVGVFSWKREAGDIKIEGRIPFMKHLVENNLIQQFIEAVKQAMNSTGTICPPQLEDVDLKTIRKKYKSDVIKQKVIRQQDAQEGADDEGPINSTVTQQISFDDQAPQEVKIKVEKKGKNK